MTTRANAIPSTSALDPDLVARIHGFIIDHAVAEEPIAAASDPFWAGLSGLGTALWLDTGDLEAADALWCDEFEALTTNNTLLNTEVQKGAYDQVIRSAADQLGGLPARERVTETALILNAIHGLRLVQRFGARVSVELHTDLAHDAEAAVFHGRRLHAVCPERFIVKVPFTPAGLIAVRRLRAEGIPVNMTLGFSARQNRLAAALAEPEYVNVFLGRLGAYVIDNKLGDGVGVGEKACLASQRAVASLGKATQQIAASLRDAGQIAALAGVDVMTMPTKVAQAARASLPREWRDRRQDDPMVAFAPGVDAKTFEHLWEILPADRALAQRLVRGTCATPAEIVTAAKECGCASLFPEWTPADLGHLASDGKIPRHERWSQRIARGEVAIDSLLNAAGLASFAGDQAKLDQRIAEQIAS